MSQPSGEKTEQPTSRRLREARKKGQVAKSKEISSAVVITGALMIVWLGWDFFLDHFKKMILLPSQYCHLPFKTALPFVFKGILLQMGILVGPVVVAVIVLGILANMLQIGLLFAIEPIKPDLNKLNPVEGFKKIFELNNLIELLKSITKVLFLTVMIYGVIKAAVASLTQIPYWGLSGVLNGLGAVIGKIVIFTIMAFGVVALLDHFFQKYLYLRKHKMTKDEVRQERKEMFGDPIIKGKRKRLHKELSMNLMLSDMRKASVLITNPTHLAIALYYDEQETGLPIVLAKGEDHLARQMVNIAREENIPIMQNVPLAHSLYNGAEIHDYIPQELIRPVAEVIRWVRTLKT